MARMLEGKTAIVTGAGSGIGRQVALKYAAEGACVTVSDIDEAGGAETVKQIRALDGRVMFFRADTSKPADHEALVKATIKEFGGLHIATNNAGIAGPQAPVGEYPVEGWDRVVAVNLSGVFYGMRYQLPAMLQAGGGAIVNMASILAQVGFRHSSAYAAAKHGIIGLTQTAALEYGPQKVRVNAVGPGFIKTPLIEKNIDAAGQQALAAMHPLGRLGEAAEVAELVLWLSSNKASFVTGGYYAVDGGYLAQ